MRGRMDGSQAASSSRSARRCSSTATRASCSAGLARQPRRRRSRGWPQPVARSSSSRRAPIALGRQRSPCRKGRSRWSIVRLPPPWVRSASRTPTRRRFADAASTAAQILLTLGDTEERRRYLNAREHNRARCSPIARSRSSTRTIPWRPTEIRYGDNDRLAARVASMMSADCLVLLSDVDGFYTAPPGSGRAHAARRGARDHAGDRGDGRRRRLRAIERRHGHQDRSGEDRARAGHAYGDRVAAR